MPQKTVSMTFFTGHYIQSFFFIRESHHVSFFPLKLVVEKTHV